MHRLAFALPLLFTACSSDPDPEPGPGPVETVPMLDKIRIGSWDTEPNFQRVRAPFDLGAGPFARATLVLDLASPCFPFEAWVQPPAGHRWPADCDAFDRNFEVTLHEPLAPDAPPLELSRAITPFGGPMHLEIDITDVANGRSGPAELEVYIATWSDSAGQVSGSHGGWTASARVELQRGKAPRNVLAVVPLVRLNHTAAEPGAPVTVTAPPGTVTARLEYRATGHGGAAADGECIGPADEFCARRHRILLDGAELAMMTPWRMDCQTLCTVTQAPAGFSYCKENPCGAMGSVRAPRANWCPGSPVAPFTWEPPALAAPGPHQFAYEIRNVSPAGGMWSISATAFFFGE